MIGNILRYKGYSAKILYSAHEKMLYGRVEGISDPIVFQCTSSECIEEAFHRAVNEYILDCKANNKVPDKSYSGLFNVRIKPELHRKLSQYAINNGMTLNRAVAMALEEFTNSHE